MSSASIPQIPDSDGDDRWISIVSIVKLEAKTDIENVFSYCFFFLFYFQAQTLRPGQCI